MKTIFALLFILVTSLAHAEPPSTVPEGFELQTLDITDGNILKPKGWFYRYFTAKSSIIWTISKEDSKLGEYLTGMRIQFTPGFSRVTNKTPQAFAQQYISQKKQSAKTFKDCKAGQAGEFTRVCLETLEKMTSSKGDIEFQILYSVFWSNEKDLFAITTFGAPASEWVTVQPIIDVMKDFELLGKEFWNKNKNDP